MASSSSMNSREITAPILPHAPGPTHHAPTAPPAGATSRNLLQKSHTASVVPSQTIGRVATVHAAPVGCLPPPGAPPAAVNCAGKHVLTWTTTPGGNDMLAPALTAHTDLHRHHVAVA